MNVRIGFSCKSHSSVKPIIRIDCNNRVLISSETLSNASEMDNESPTLHYVNFDIANVLQESNTIKVSELNITHDLKSEGEFGFRVDHIIIDNIDISYFYIGGTVHAPIPNNDINDGFAQYLINNNKGDAIIDVNGNLTFVESGEYVNYVNMPLGHFEFTFKSPVYQWLLSQNFGYSFTILR